MSLLPGAKGSRILTNVIHRISKEEDDVEEKLDPSIRYLQKLGAEHLSQIFESARWIFDTDKDMAFQVGNSNVHNSSFCGADVFVSNVDLHIRRCGASASACLRLPGKDRPSAVHPLP